MSEAPTQARTDLLIICLFESVPSNALHASLLTTNEHLDGLLSVVRRPALFGGELGETMLVTPPRGAMSPRRILFIGLGDAQTFSPPRMRFVGRVAMSEADRLAATHPYFAPSVLDGGVTKYTSGDSARFVVAGFQDGYALATVLRNRNAAPAPSVVNFAYLAGAANVSSTKSAVARAMIEASAQAH